MSIRSTIRRCLSEANFWPDQRTGKGRVVPPGERVRYLSDPEPSTMARPTMSSSRPKLPARNRSLDRRSCWGCGSDYHSRWNGEDLIRMKKSSKYSGSHLCPDCYEEEGMPEMLVHGA